MSTEDDANRAAAAARLVRARLDAEYGLIATVRKSPFIRRLWKRACDERAAAEAFFGEIRNGACFLYTIQGFSASINHFDKGICAGQFVLSGTASIDYEDVEDTDEEHCFRWDNKFSQRSPTERPYRFTVSVESIGLSDEVAIDAAIDEAVTSFRAEKYKADKAAVKEILERHPEMRREV